MPSWTRATPAVLIPYETKVRFWMQPSAAVSLICPVKRVGMLSCLQASKPYLDEVTARQ